jgi:limonene-1,2-epoxide hydrolase
MSNGETLTEMQHTEDRKIVGWRDYMDSLAAMSSLT